MFNIVGHKNIFLTASGLAVGLSIVAILVFGFREGIDFSGGTLWQFRASSGAPNEEEITNIMKTDLGIQEEVRINYDFTDQSVLARLPVVDETTHQKGLALLRDKLPGFEELSFQSIGPSVGKELRTKALWAIALVLLGISFYIAFAFRRVSRPVSSWKYGVITLLTLFHDVLIPAGLLAVLGHYSRAEIDGNFVVALLVVMGFSVHDTIVVFDRTRENLSLDRGRTDFGETINKSVNQTLGRSVNTSFTLILVLIALLLLGPATLHYFVLTLLVGVTVGIYSSIFVASPLLLVWQMMGRK